MRKKLFIIALLLSNPLFAQVNIEPVRAKLKGKEKLSGEIDFSLKVNQGNDDKLRPSSSILSGYRNGNHFIFLNASGSYEKDDGELEDREAFAHIRYNFQFYSWLWGEVFEQIETNENRRIQQRRLSGIGPRFGIEWNRFGGYYGSAYMFEQNNIANEFGNTYLNMHRWSNYWSLILDFDEIVISNTTYYQPKLDNFKDYRTFSITKLDISATDLLGAQFAATVKYENNVPDGVKKRDIEYINSLVLKF